MKLFDTFKRLTGSNSVTVTNQNMTQDTNSKNSHINTYLDYYCNLSAPGFAVLLKGEWGSGKTWFIKKYLDQLKLSNKKFSYVSLYGKTNIAEIESDIFLQGLIPDFPGKNTVIKNTAIIGQLFKAGAKKFTGFDLDKINPTEYLNNFNKSILIFDDLERCQINTRNILGYINYFVEHQGLKVVIIADESKISDPAYNAIKEKLIGKTLNIISDFNGALENFISNIDVDIKNFLIDNIELIQDIYQKAECDNLRILKQIVLDFDRIFQELPPKAKKEPAILKDILKVLMIFSIEIRTAKILPQDISNLEEVYISLITKKYYSSFSENISDVEKNNEDKTPLQKIFEKYSEIDLYQTFPNAVWWTRFFDKGILDQQELEQSILNSKYFEDENTSNWIRLYNCDALSDHEFIDLIKKVELEYKNKEFTEIGVIQHITGLLLSFSHIGLYNRSKEDISQDSKLYIDYLKNNHKLDISQIPDRQSYGRLGFLGKEFQEFQEFCDYIIESIELAIVENRPNDGQKLFDDLQRDLYDFCRIIESEYRKIPILKYIKPEDFIEKFLLMTYEDKRYVCYKLKQRYNSINNEELLEELEWFRSIRTLVLKEANRNKGKLSGYLLNSLNEHYFNGIIEKYGNNNLENK